MRTESDDESEDEEDDSDYTGDELDSDESSAKGKRKTRGAAKRDRCRYGAKCYR